MVKGSKHKEESKQLIKEKVSGENHYLYGKELPISTKQQISETKTGTERLDCCKRVVQLTKDEVGVYINTFNSIKDAAMMVVPDVPLENSTKGIGRVCNGSQLKAYEYKWIFEDMYLSNTPIIYKRTSKKTK